MEREPQHHPVFENAYVRVLDVRLPPGYVSLFHVHSNDNVSVRIATGPTRVDLPGRTGEVQTPPVGRVAFNTASPPYTHRVVNLGTTEIHIIDIDIVAHALAQPSSVDDDLGGHQILIDNDRVRVSRIVLAPGTQAPAHTHRRSWLSVVVRGAVPGSFAWHGAGSLATIRDPEVVEVEVK